MPFRRQGSRSPGFGGLQRRQSVEAMEKYLRADGDAPAILVGSIVTRGLDWDRGAEDGGVGETGVVVSVDSEGQHATVRWNKTGELFGGYRIGDVMDLAMSEQQAPQPVVRKESIQRRNSQASFADPSQCIIIYDWDDTLFPTTYVRDDLELNWRKPMRDQAFDARTKAEIAANLDRCAFNVLELLKQSARYGKVVLVTLAKRPWVTESCTNFFPAVGRLIKELKVPIVYAQDNEQVDYNKQAFQSCEETEKFWSMMKGRAIAAEIREFYSQYEGQSWKNIISIGDSDFERLGTQYATEDYMKETGIAVGDDAAEVDNHVYKVRTKTFKMVDQPTIEELTVEVTMLHKWLPLMVKLDGGFDANLNDVEDPRTLQSIERKLRFQGKKKAPA